MVIELDVEHHFSAVGIEKNRERDVHLQEFGIKLLRFDNKVALNNLNDVLKSIKSHFKVE